MQLFKSLILFLLFNHVSSQIIYTKNKYGEPKNILLKPDGTVTDKYPGGIWLLTEDQQRYWNIFPLHKKVDDEYFNDNANRNPGRPQIYIRNSLYTKDRDGEFVPILNKNGDVTKRYNGGLYIRDQNNMEINIHKTPKDDYFKVRQRNPRNIIPNQVNIPLPPPQQMNQPPLPPRPQQMNQPPHPPPLPLPPPIQQIYQQPFNLNDIINNRQANEIRRRVRSRAKTVARRRERAINDAVADATRLLFQGHRHNLRRNRRRQAKAP